MPKPLGEAEAAPLGLAPKPSPLTWDRRAFLRAGAWTAGAVLIGVSCAGDDDDGPTADRPSLDPDTADPAPRPTVRIAGAALGFPSPFAYIAGPGYWQMSYVYDSLLWRDASGELLPWLAAGFDVSDDRLTYTFDLREGVTWHDGEPLTAEDVAFTFDYYADATLPPLVIAQPRGTTSVQAVDDRTVEIRLEEPDVTFAEFVAGALPIVPQHVWSDISDPAQEQDLEVLVGSGPFRLESYDGDSAPLAYEAYDDYFLGRPFVERIEMIPVGEGQDFTALDAGEVDAAGISEEGGVRPEVLAPFRSDDRFGLVEAAGGFTFPLFWNLERGGALADVAFRRACAMAIDRDDLVERLAGGNGQPGNPGFLPPDHPFHAEVEQYPFDPAAAEDLLDEAGYRRDGDGPRLSFELLFATEGTQVAELVIAALAEIGVELTARAVELGPQLFVPKQSGDYDLAITLYPGPSGFAPTTDPDYLRGIYSSRLPAALLNSTNGFQDEEFDDLADRQRQTGDEAERRDLVARMQEIVAEALPVLPLYYADQFFVFDRDVFDQWSYTPDGFGPGLIEPTNKQLLVTGVTSGTEIRPIRDGG